MSQYFQKLIQICEDAAPKGAFSEEEVAETAKLAVYALMDVTAKACNAKSAYELNEINRSRLDLVDYVRGLVRGMASAPLYAVHASELNAAVDVSFYAAIQTCGLIVYEKPVIATICHTYIVRNPSNGLIKIGRSGNPRKRIASLQTASGAELEILAIVEGDEEKDLHRQFKHLRSHGEWFSDDGSIVDCAENMRLCSDLKFTPEGFEWIKGLWEKHLAEEALSTAGNNNLPAV